MDLRAVQQQQQEEEARQHMQGYPAAVTSASDTPSWLPACELRLKLGAVIAAEMRQAVKQEAGFRCVQTVKPAVLLERAVVPHKCHCAAQMPQWASVCCIPATVLLARWFQ
jgi:hypothetical protein